MVHHRVVPVAGISIENELVISDRPSLHTTDIAVDDGSGEGILPNRSIIEDRRESELPVLKPRVWRGRISTGPTCDEYRVLGLVEQERVRDQEPFFPPVSARRELGSVPGGGGDLVWEVRLGGAGTVVDNWGDTDPALQ